MPRGARRTGPGWDREDAPADPDRATEPDGARVRWSRTLPGMRTDDMLAANRANWDARVPVHLDGGYDLAALRAGRPRLAGFEYAAMDVAGRDVLHLQCHLGTDTICLARHGGRAVGLDFSSASVAAARTLADECAVDVEYVEGDVYDAVAALRGRRFDVVYTGKGALCWLPDLPRWAGVVAALLRPGGSLHVVEFHPVLQAAAEQQPGPGLLLTEDYFAGYARRYDSDVSYDGSGRLAGRTVSYQWRHTLGDVTTAVLGADLRIAGLEEHFVTPWGPWPGLVPRNEGWWGWPAGSPRLPLLYSLHAVRDAPDGC